MRTKSVRNRNRPYSWRDCARDPALTTMLAVQCMIIFAEPFAATGFNVVHDVVQLLFFAATFIVYLISGGPIATTLAISAFISDSAGYVRDLVEPSKILLILGYAGSITAFAVACYALGYAALNPGVMTVHRVLGAIVLYLNIGLMYGTMYRLIWYFRSGFFDKYSNRRKRAVRWHDRLFQLCHFNVDRLWRDRPSPSSRPYPRDSRQRVARIGADRRRQRNLSSGRGCQACQLTGQADCEHHHEAGLQDFPKKHSLTFVRGSRRSKSCICPWRRRIDDF